MTLMRRRTRKLIGTIAILVFVMIYGPLAMALAESRIQEAAQFVQVLAYLVLGLAWILPLLPLIRWMERPDPEERA
jgi:predicted PurR-regulated permease PerM